MKKSPLRKEATFFCNAMKLPGNDWKCCNCVISLFKFRILVKALQKGSHEGSINK